MSDRRTAPTPVRAPAPATVLVVDDERANLRLIGDLVLREGYRLVTATDGYQALDRLADTSIDAVLLDLMMPGMSGHGVLLELSARGRLPELPVIVVTAIADRGERIAALEAGATDFIVKPIDQYELAMRLRNAVRMHSLRRDLQRRSDRLERSEKKVQKALALRESELRRAQEVAGLASGVIDLKSGQGSPLDAWSANLLGLPEGSRLSFDRLLSMVADPAARELVIASRERLRRGERVEMLIPLVSEGGTRYFRGVAEPQDEGLSGFRTAIATLQDVTDQRQMQEALLQARNLEALGRLAGGIAHDFNNFLAVVMSYAQLIQVDLPDGHSGVRDLRAITDACRRAAKLVSELLTFARESPRATPEPVDLNECLHRTLGLIRVTVGKRILVGATPASDPAIVLAEPAQLDRILLNLASNARDAMGGGRGELTIRVDHDAPPPVRLPPGRYCSITVVDNGSGMEAQVAERIFEPFFTTKAQGLGTGLGLATTYGIVRDGGGCIEVESAPGAGATFTIFLPVYDGEDGAPGADAVADTDELRPLRVLLVEGQQVLRDVVTRMLAGDGHAVVATEDFASARALLRSDEADIELVVADLALVRAGSSTFTADGNVIWDGPTVCTTATDDEATLAFGAVHCCTLVAKPFTLADLRGAIAAALRIASDRARS